MRGSDYRKYRDLMHQDEDEQYQQKNSRRGNANKNFPNFEKKKYYNKYGAHPKSKYDSILNPDQQQPQNSRQDYDYRRPPQPKEIKQRQVYGRQGGYPQRHYRNTNNRRDTNNQANQLNEELDKYRRKAQNLQRKEQRVPETRDYRKDKQDFIERKEYQSNRVNKRNDESFEIEKDEKKVNYQLQKKQRRPFKKSEQSEQISLNKGFNKFQQSNNSNSSIWCQSKILQNLSISNDQSNHSIISNPNESYVSSIRQKSQIYDSQQILHNGQAKQLVQGAPSILDQLQKCKQANFISIEVSIINKKNVLEAITKQILLVKGNLKVDLTLKQEGIIVRNKEIQFQKLCQYIQFQRINAVYPKMHNPDPVACKFILCKIKAILPEDPQIHSASRFIKKQKKKAKPSLDCSFLIKITQLQMKCMNCETSNLVPIIASDNLASLSCRNCNQQMIAEIKSISREE